MKKTTFFFLSVLFSLFVGGNAWADETWVKTAPGELQSGDIVAIVELTNSYALTSSNGTTAAPKAEAVELNAEKTEITGAVADAWQWEVTVGDGTFQFCVPGTTNYLYCTNTNNGVRVGTNENNVFSIKQYEENGVDFLYNDGQGRYIGVYATNPDWRCYTTVNNNIKEDVVAFFKRVLSGVVVAKPVISPAGGAFSEPQEVTISTEEGLTAYYTLDGTDPTNESTAYVAPFTVSTDCTVKAVAYDAAGNASSVASVEFQFAKTYTNIADLCAAATEAKEPVLVEFNNWICTGVKNSNAYFTDGRNGILLYQNGHGFAVGDVLTGQAQISLTLYNECAEIVGLTSTTEGLTVTKGGEATPQKVMVADLEKNMQGCLISLEGVTYTGGVFVDDDDNSITPYGTFIKLPELYEGKTYDVTGVAIWYKNSQVWEIAPRTADEFVLKTSQVAPVSAWSVESESVDIEGQPTAKFTTNSDGVVTYESSAPEVATIDADGRITPKAYGTTVITANVAETATYLADCKSFTLIVKEKGYADAIFAYNDADISGQGVSSTGGEFTAVRNDVVTLHVNKAYANPNDNHIKIYGSKVEKGAEGEEPTLTEPSYIELTVADGYAIKSIVLTAAGESYIKEWKDQFGTAAEVDGPTATWSGDMGKVVLTNQATSQARIQTITVTYVDTSIIDAIVAPAAAVQETAIYNLAGQRMQKMQKGINIVNGKKLLR